MPKSEHAQNSLERRHHQSIIHHPVILDLLESDGQPCSFEPAALDLARHGLHIHPLRSAGKIPIFKGWQHKATTDPDVIAGWAADYPTANPGILTGAQSGVIALDCDLRHGAAESLDWLKRHYGGIPFTWTTITPNGWHFYFAHPGGQVRHYNALASGIEIKGDGGNLVGPGSVHPTGLMYRWQLCSSPADIPLAPTPEWLLDILQRKRKWTPEAELRPEARQVNILGDLDLEEGVGLADGIPESLSGADMLSYFSQEWVIEKVLPLLGLRGVAIGEKFHCVLHPEGRESAAILRPEVAGNPFMYMDFHEREEGRRAYPLPTVYRHVLRGKPGGRVKRLPKPTFVVWALRLLRDAGVIKGVKIEAPRLPETVKASVRRVYEGFVDLLSLKFLLEREASPYTWAFVSEWVGVSREVAASALRWLIGTGYLRFIKYFGSEDAGNRMQLFLLGTRSWIRRLSGRGLLERGGQTEIVADLQGEAEAEAREQQAEAEAKAAVKLCRKCGEVRDWFTFGEVLVCAGCFQQLDSG